MLCLYGDQWIELRPDAGSSTALAAATKRVTVEGRAFGPVLDAKAAPDSLVWRVTASGDVKRRKDLWLLGEPDGVPLGLHLGDWRAKFGKRCIVEPARRGRGKPPRACPPKPWRRRAR